MLLSGVFWNIPSFSWRLVTCPFGLEIFSRAWLVEAELLPVLLEGFSRSVAVSTHSFKSPDFELELLAQEPKNSIPLCPMSCLQKKLCLTSDSFRSSVMARFRRAPRLGWWEFYSNERWEWSDNSVEESTGLSVQREVCSTLWRNSVLQRKNPKIIAVPYFEILCTDTVQRWAMRGLFDFQFLPSFRLNRGDSRSSPCSMLLPGHVLRASKGWWLGGVSKSVLTCAAWRHAADDVGRRWTIYLRNKGFLSMLLMWLMLEMFHHSFCWDVHPEGSHLIVVAVVVYDLSRDFGFYYMYIALGSLLYFLHTFTFQRHFLFVSFLLSFLLILLWYCPGFLRV